MTDANEGFVPAEVRAVIAELDMITSQVMQGRMSLSVEELCRRREAYVGELLLRHEPIVVEPELTPEQIKYEAVRRLRVLGEEIMAGRPDEHELIDQIEQGIDQMIKDDWSQEPEMPEVMAALMGVRVRRS
jgi:hypothetical protein